MPSTVYTTTPPMSILTNSDAEDLIRLMKRPETWIEIESVKGKIYLTRSGNIAMVAKMSAAEIEHMMEQWKAEAEAQRAKTQGEISKVANPNAPFIKVLGNRR